MCSDGLANGRIWHTSSDFGDVCGIFGDVEFWAFWDIKKTDMSNSE